MDEITTELAEGLRRLYSHEELAGIVACLAADHGLFELPEDDSVALFGYRNKLLYSAKQTIVPAQKYRALQALLRDAVEEKRGSRTI